MKGSPNLIKRLKTSTTTTTMILIIVRFKISRSTLYPTEKRLYTLHYSFNIWIIQYAGCPVKHRRLFQGFQGSQDYSLIKGYSQNVWICEDVMLYFFYYPCITVPLPKIWQVLLLTNSPPPHSHLYIVAPIWNDCRCVVQWSICGHCTHVHPLVK